MSQHLSGPPSLEGQVALITGGSGGMGRAIASVFKAAGARVVATDLGENEDIEGCMLIWWAQPTDYLTRVCSSASVISNCL